MITLENPKTGQDFPVDYTARCLPSDMFHLKLGMFPKKHWLRAWFQ
jgi:hypothetical protein